MSAIAIVCGAATVVASNFEPNQWSLAGSDCQPRIQIHRRAAPSRELPTAEQLRIIAGTGTYCHVQKSIRPTYVINDLKLSVDALSTRNGIQLLARTVFPHARHPETAGPLTMLMPGGSYSCVGQWQSLELDEIRTKLSRQVHTLRLQFGPDIDLREAYLDQLVVNVFGGPGTTDVWLGSLMIQGEVNVPSGSLNLETLTRDLRPVTVASAPPPDVRIDGDLLRVGGEPFFARIIEDRGEAWQLLADLGFNTIALSNPASSDQMAVATRLGLWLICPLPANMDQQPVRDRSCILAWDVGSHVDPHESSGEQDSTDRLPGRFLERHRLIFDPWTEVMPGNRAADIIVVDAESLSDVWSNTRFPAELAASPSSTGRSRTVYLVSMPTMPNSIPAQSSRSTGNDLVESESESESDCVTAERIRRLAFVGIAAGARGIWFRSAARLDSQDAATQLRRATFRQLNLQLRWIEPWTTGATHGVHLASHGYFRRSTERAHLLLPVSDVGPVANDTMVIDGLSESSHAFSILPIGLRPLSTHRTTGGLGMSIPAVFPSAPIFVTANSQTVSWMNQSLAKDRRLALTLEHELAEAELAYLTTVIAQRQPPDGERSNQMQSSLGMLARRIDEARQSIDANDLHAADYKLAKVRFELGMCLRDSAK